MPAPKDIDAYLTTRYFDPKSPASFTSAFKLYQSIKNEGKYDISFERIQRWADKQDSLTLYRDVKRRQKRYRRVITGGISSMWDADLLVLNKDRFTSANSGFGYILLCIDCFSRKCYATVSKSKSSNHMVQAFSQIFKKITPELIPKTLRTDRGVEFRAKEVQEYLFKMGIHHYYGNSQSKANYSEILIKNFKRRLFRLFEYRNSYTFTDVLESFVQSYNQTYHSTIKMKPDEVNKDNEQALWNNLYLRPEDYARAFKNALIKKKKKHFKHNINDTVRVSYTKQHFTRDFDTKYTNEVFTVVDRRLRDQNIPVYRLKDYSGETVEGEFYQSEITPVTFDENAAFKIEKVLKTRTNQHGKKESLVKWQSWPSKYNSWIPTETVKRIKTKKRKKATT